MALSWHVATAQRSARVARARQPHARHACVARCLGVNGAAHAPGRSGLSACVRSCSHARPQQARDGGREGARRGARRAEDAGVRCGPERGAGCRPAHYFRRYSGAERPPVPPVCGADAAAACAAPRPQPRAPPQRLRRQLAAFIQQWPSGRPRPTMRAARRRPTRTMTRCVPAAPRCVAQTPAIGAAARNALGRKLLRYAVAAFASCRCARRFAGVLQHCISARCCGAGGSA